MTKKSHVRVVISDNLEREMAKKYPQHILFYLLQEGELRMGMGIGMVWDGLVSDGPEWAGKTEESWPNTPRKCRKVCGDKPATRQRF